MSLRFSDVIGRPSIVLPVDQIVFAATNFLPLLALGAIMEPSDFGFFTVFFGFISGIGILLRSWTGVPSLLTTGGKREVKLMVSLCVGTVVGLGAIVLGSILADSGESRLVVFAFALGAPAAYAVDALRHEFMGLKELSSLLRLEAIWFVVEIPFLLFGLLFGRSELLLVAFAWSFGAWGALGRAATGSISFDDLRAWYQMTRATGNALSLDAVVNFVRQQGYLFLLAAVGSLVLAGSYRLAVGVVAPATMAIVGWRNHTIVSLRSPLITPSRRTRLIAIPVFVGLLVVAVAFSVPDNWLDKIAGRTEAGNLIPIIAVLTLLASFDSFSQAIMISIDRPGDVALARVVTTCLWLGPLVIWRPSEVSDVAFLLLFSGGMSTVVWLVAGFLSSRRFAHKPVVPGLESSR